MARHIYTLLAVLLCSLSAGAAQVEVPVSSTEYGPAAGDQSNAVAAGNGELFLVAWSDRVQQSEVYVARVSASGEVLDRPPRPIAVSPASGVPVALAWSGRYFLLAWLETTTYSTHVTKIDRDGNVAGDVELARVMPTSLTCHATRCLLTAADWSPFDRKLHSFMFTPDGAVHARAFIADLPGSHYSVRSATDGSDFLVTWQRFGADLTPRQAFYSTRVSGSGEPGPIHTLGVEPFGTHTLVRSSDGYVVAWGMGSGVTLLRLGDDGSRISGPAVSTVPDENLRGPIVLLPDATGYLAVALVDPLISRLVAFRLGGDGAVESSATPINSRSGFSFDAAASAGQVLITWSEYAPTGLDVYVRLFTTSGHPLTEAVSMSVSARPQRSPAAAWDGDRLLSVWQEAVEGRWQVRMSVLRASVARITERAVHASPNDQTQPKVAISATAALVVWEERLTLLARRFTADGEPLDGDPITLTDRLCSAGAAVASDGRDFLVTWTDCADSSRAVVAARVVDGAIADRIAVSAGSAVAHAGDVAWNGRQYVVSWLDQRLQPGVICDPTPCYLSTVRASRVDAAGVLHDPAGIVLSAEEIVSEVHAAAAGGDVLVAWTAWRNPPMLLGARVRLDGGTEAPRQLIPATDRRTPFSITSDGATYYLAWAEHPYGRPHALMAAEVSSIALDAAAQAVPFVVAPITARQPVIIATGSRRLTFVYERLAEEPEFGSATRVFARTLHLGGRGRSRAVSH